MFGLRFIKAQPTTYLLHYRNGKLIREGVGLSFFYFAPTSSLVSIPMATVDVPFIFKEVTADYQEVTVQGQISYRVSDPKKLSQMVNFTLDPLGQRYVSDDPQKLSQRVINRGQVTMRGYLQGVALKDAITFSEALAGKMRGSISESEATKALGIEIIDLSVLAIKPNPETSRALEADVREQLLKRADEAVYSRRNSAIEQERVIKENELNTEIAVETKRRQIRETQMDAERAVQEKKRVIKEEEMAGNILLEAKNKDLVALVAENAKKEADAKAYSTSAVMSVFSKVDPKVLQALATTGMAPDQLIALAFREMAERADKIGQLNITPDLLNQLIKSK